MSEGRGEAGVLQVPTNHTGCIGIQPAVQYMLVIATPISTFPSTPPSQVRVNMTVIGTL